VVVDILEVDEELDVLVEVDLVVWDVVGVVVLVCVALLVGVMVIVLVDCWQYFTSQTKL
jgi:hypothetical protein